MFLDTLKKIMMVEEVNIDRESFILMVDIRPLGDIMGPAKWQSKLDG